MKKIFCLGLLLLSLMTVTTIDMSAATKSAADILSALQSKMSSAPSLKADFTISSGSSPVAGTALLSGNRFKLDTPHLVVWYNGQTQWTMLKSSSEVNITEPTADELAVSNPFAVISNYDKHYSTRRLPDEDGNYRLELKPINASTGIDAIILTINKSTDMPTAVRIILSDNRQVVLTVNSIAKGASKSKADFNYNPQLYPAAEIIDLR